MLIDKKTSYKRAKQSSHNQGVEEANKIYHDKIDASIKEQHIMQFDMKKQFEESMTKKNQDLDQISKCYEKYFGKKKESIKAMRMELINLYELIIRQHNITYKVEVIFVLL